MPRQQRHKTNYPGVYYIEGTTTTSSKPEKIFYISYRKEGRKIEEKAGRQIQNGMTAAKASQMRAQRITNKEKSNRERRDEERATAIEKQNRWTIDRLWEEYKSTREVKWIKFDELRFKKYIKPLFGASEPNELTHFDIKRLRKKIKSRKVKPATERHVLELLRRVCRFGVKQNLCKGLNFTIQMPEVNNEKTEDLNDTQLNALWNAIENEENIQGKNLLKMVLFTGMRRGELFKLEWNHIDFDRRFILIKDPKGGKDEKIPLGDNTRELLLKHERPFPNSPFVFPGKNGGQRKEIKRIVNRIKENAKLPKDFRIIHGLRHVYASMLASSGQVDMYTLQNLLTHKSPQMTQRYAHLRDDALRSAANLAGNLIEGAVNNKLRIVQEN